MIKNEETIPKDSVGSEDREMDEQSGSDFGWIISEPLKQQLKKDFEALIKNSVSKTSFTEAIQPQLSTSLALVPYMPPLERILKVMGDTENTNAGATSSSSSSDEAGSNNGAVEKPGKDSAYSTDSEDEDEMINLLTTGVERMDCC